MLQLVALLLLVAEDGLVSQHALQPVAEGVASYYTVSSSSRLTASGDVLRDGLYTCAMRQGEFGGYYLVVPENGRAVVCRLNDRGPYVNGRVIDLSEAAMRQLAATEEGLLDVKVYRIGLGDVLDFLPGGWDATERRPPSQAPLS